MPEVCSCCPLTASRAVFSCKQISSQRILYSKVYFLISGFCKISGVCEEEDGTGQEWMNLCRWKR